MSSKPFLITGATGSIGRNVVEFLIERGHKVRAFVHKGENNESSQLQQLGAEIVVGDLLDFMTIRPALDGISGACFVYPIVPGIVDATAYFAQAAKEATVSTVVNTSQVSARREAKSHAAFNHWMAEQVFDWSGLIVTHLRPTFFAEWFLYYAQNIKDGLVQMPFGESKHAPIAAEDVARVIVSILENPSAHKGKTYQLFGPKEYTYPEAIAEISAILGHKITYEKISLEAFREWGLKSSRKKSPFFAQHVFEVAQDHAAGIFSGTDEVIEKITGHKPMELEEFIRKHRSAFE
jgi:NAD(P)H dehydrogenase (quinone)